MTGLNFVWAGIYVGFGSFLAFTVGGNLQDMAVNNPGLQKFLYGAIGLPAGLVMVCLLPITPLMHQHAIHHGLRPNTALFVGRCLADLA